MIGDEIFEKLSRKYKLKDEEYIAPRLLNRDLFEFIVAVILSQNTSDYNAWRAFNNLLNALGSITPEKILNINEQKLAELIKIAGMQHQRSRKIIELATAFKSNNIEQLLIEQIRKGNYEEARRYLMDLPGIGSKTADVVLLMKYGVPTFPVDTHIMRITIRLGFVKNKNYEACRRFWMMNTSPDHYLHLHLLLITHGRRTCKARSPECLHCVIRDHCEWYLGRGK
ncbi:MAG: endonuclease III [Desulfurococcaceae archaeon]